MSFITDTLFGSDAEQTGQAQSYGDLWLQSALQPLMQRGITAGLRGSTAPGMQQGQLYPVAGLPGTPQAQGYTAQGYGLPNPYGSPKAPFSSPADFAGGYENIINRMMEPYGDALGGSMGGFSGAGQNIMGSAMGQIAPSIMGQYTQSRLPYDQMQMQASRDPYMQQVGANQFGALAQNQAAQFGAGAQNQMAGLGYQGGLQQMSALNQAFGAPWNMAGLYGGSTGSPIVQPGQQGLVPGLIGGLASGAGMAGGMYGMDQLFG